MKRIAAIAAGLFVAACDEAYAQSYTNAYDTTPVDITWVASHGPLTAENGMTLYTFDKDEAGVSNCYDSCADNWPPYLVGADDTPREGYTQVNRNDGTTQWVKDGAPLYFWVGDIEAGDTTGDGVGGVWHIAK